MVPTSFSPTHSLPYSQLGDSPHLLPSASPDGVLPAPAQHAFSCASPSGALQRAYSYPYASTSSTPLVESHPIVIQPSLPHAALHDDASGSSVVQSISPSSSHDPFSDGVDGAPRSSPGRAKKYPCIGCDSMFERPSSLKQHMLSHTGEKPHSCPHCDRRFSVASNLRRHLRSCQASKHRSNDATSQLTAAPGGSFASPGPSVVGSPPPPPPPPPATTVTIPTTTMHGHRTTPYPRTSNTNPTPSSTSRSSQKRRNAANRWLPQSLASLSNAASLTSTPPFNFPPLTIVSLPLPPVTPRRGPPPVGSPSSSADGDDADALCYEERDSYNTFPPQPYHPSQWQNRLPGPALLPADELVKNATVARRWILQA